MCFLYISLNLYRLPPESSFYTFMLQCVKDFFLGDILALCPSARSSPLWLWGLQTTSLQKSSRPWRTGRASMGLSATGGRWASACTKCCTERRLSMQSRWWKRMGRSWTTRWAWVYMFVEHFHRLSSCYLVMHPFYFFHRSDFSFHSR